MSILRTFDSESEEILKPGCTAPPVDGFPGWDPRTLNDEPPPEEEKLLRAALETAIRL